MSHLQTQTLPTIRSLFKATAVAVGLATALLITVVLPAEYRIDPTGIGQQLGLNALSQTTSTTKPSATAAADTEDSNAVLAAKAEAAFGKHAGRALNTSAVSVAGNALSRNTLTVTLPPGKGAEVKAHLGTGEGLTFRWQATGNVAVDMHGEQSNAKDAWTSYAVEASQQEAAGTFIAPFEGKHGWYWENRGTEPVTVVIEVFGFQSELYQP